MKITRIDYNNLKSLDKNCKVSAKQLEAISNSQKIIQTPSFAYKQFALSFSGKEDDIEDKQKDKNIDDDIWSSLEASAKQFSSLPLDEQNKMLNNLTEKFLKFICLETINERDRIQVPQGLSFVEEELYKSVFQLVNTKSMISRNPENVMMFSNAFATKSIEIQIWSIPNSAPIFKNEDFIDLFQSLNVIENAQIGRMIRYSFKNDKNLTQYKLFNKHTLGREPVIEEEHWAKYERTPNHFVYVEENEEGTNLTKIVETYKHSIFEQEKPSIAFEFDTNGYLSKITKFGGNSNILVELILDNQNKTVTVLENEKEPRIIGFKDDAFFEN